MSIRSNKEKHGISGTAVYNGEQFRRMPDKKISAAVYQRLMRAARKAMQNAHAPYSNFHVGAAILTSKGKIYSGCNVENASYGMTNCAERTAIFTAVAELGPKMEITAVAVTTD